MNSKDYIKHLNLIPHPEGGYYREMYRSSLEINQESLPSEFGHSCNLATAIYYLLEKGDFSCFHKIKSDEIWHHYDGGVIEIHCINELGKYQCLRLGKDLQQAMPMQIVPANVWFASCLAPETDFALAACTVSPGFDFQDFEMANRDELLALFAQHKNIICQLTR